ncbi:hypothetical protein GGR56DRAFT_667120 [Xylariaceae sp. FL0804]|nr:hypothetical protein GGR56DRAFT_667120 [Xylariaceae sp. FL0804]
MSNSSSAGVANTSRHVRSRTQSISSDRPSSIGTHGLMSPPLAVTPEASFIAASAASQIVTNDHDSHAETWYDQVGLEPSGETALVTNGALQLANNFIDQLLFNIIAVAKSTALSALRPAVSDVLKPKLAKDAMNQADEELQEYLGGNEMEDLLQSPRAETPIDWDLELVWKRTRLRCMVYSSLGDMEEDDEDYYMEQEHLNGESEDILAEPVSPAVAIFLTSILEFMGEQILVVAGQSAFNRLRTRYEKELKEGARSPGELSERVMVEDFDMERVALDRTLGRLWRAWKKRIRSHAEPNYSRPFSRSSTAGSAFSMQRRESSATEVMLSMPPSKHHSTGVETPEDTIQSGAETAGREHDPADLPLPDSDVEAEYSDEEESEEEDDLPPRPKSWIVSLDSKLDLLLHPSAKRARSLPPTKRRRYQTIASADEQLDPAESRSTDERNAEADAVNEVESHDGDTQEAKDEPELDTSPQPKGLLAKITTGAAAVGTAATEAEDDQTEDEVDDFAEEPQIMTSSRVSIGGRSSPAVSETGRPPSVILPTRSSSMRSVRVIDSRPVSIDAQQDPALIAVARTPPIVEEKRNALVMPSPTDDTRNVNASLPTPVRNRSPLTSSPSPSSQMPTPSQIAIAGLGISHDDRFEQSPKPVNNLRTPPMPTLPERSASRPNYSQGQASSFQRGASDSPKIARFSPAESAPPSASKFKPIRTSEDGGMPRPADATRKFEELIQSNETLQYTLTPENMRDIVIRKSEEINTKPSDRSRSSSIQRSISVSKSTGLSSHPPTDLPPMAKMTSTAQHNYPPVSSRNRVGPAPQARDARVPRESIQDFAEFIRSTGPPSDGRVPPNRANASNATIVRNVSGPTILPAKSSLEGGQSNHSARARLQARDATINASSESSELIDFIRRGPPNASGNNPRIPRNVAPFRNTMDSEQMQMTGAVGGKAVDAVIPNVRTSQTSTNMTESSAPSSLNSQSALLNKASKQPYYSGNNFDDEDMMPKKTRRRIRDPYALDFSDDEDELEMTPKPKPKQEESLIDFLNNYPPPAEPVSQPIVMPKKKSSAPNLLQRLRSAGNSNGASNTNRRGSASAENKAPAAHAGSGRAYTPIVIPVGAENYSTEYKAPPPLEPRVSANRVPMKKFEPREAASTNTRTSDLAQFLRDSEPPPSALASPPPEDKSSGFARMFERRKKSTAY